MQFVFKIYLQKSGSPDKKPGKETKPALIIKV